MVPAAGLHTRPRTRLPRMRGDGPLTADGWRDLKTAPPHARGWSRLRVRPHRRLRGSPACAGMVPPSISGGIRSCRLPRMRGDGPRTSVNICDRTLAPPHARRWSHARRLERAAARGSPACAGMVPCPAHCPTAARGLPRMRGDGPQHLRRLGLAEAASPHARGWSHGHADASMGDRGSPACAGMVPDERWQVGLGARLPRMRGDGLHISARLLGLFKAPPHARGWSQGHGVRECPDGCSPACAGMVLSMAARRACVARLPRMRGDGPQPADRVHAVSTAPPHARGWSRRAHSHPRSISGSPAYAGMVRAPNDREFEMKWLPRIRGDGLGNRSRRRSS